MKTTITKEKLEHFISRSSVFTFINNYLLLKSNGKYNSVLLKNDSWRLNFEVLFHTHTEPIEKINKYENKKEKYLYFYKSFIKKMLEYLKEFDIKNRIYFPNKLVFIYYNLKVFESINKYPQELVEKILDEEFYNISFSGEHYSEYADVNEIVFFKYFFSFRIIDYSIFIDKLNIKITQDKKTNQKFPENVNFFLYNVKFKKNINILANNIYEFIRKLENTNYIEIEDVKIPVITHII